MAFYSSYKPQVSGVAALYAGTDTAVNSSTGLVTVWNTSTFQSVTDRGNSTTNLVIFSNTTESTGTSTGAVTISGGLGVGGSLNASSVNASSMFVNGEQVLTSSSNFVKTLSAGSDISVSSSTGDVTISNISTLQSVTDRGNSTTNAISIYNTSTSLDKNSGALSVSGGVGIAGNLNVGSTIDATTQLYVLSDSLDPLNSSTFILESGVPIGYSAFTIKNSGISGQSYTFDLGGNNRALTGGTSINEGNLILKDDIANQPRLIVTKTGNMLINSSVDNGATLQVNGSLTVENTATFSGISTFTGTATFTESIIIQTTLQETRVTLVNTTGTTEVDNFDASIYRSCKSLVQVQDGNDFHITEIVLLHDNLGQVYKSEYGIISTGGERGVFTADLQLDGIVRLYFEASSASNKTVSIVKTAIAV